AVEERVTDLEGLMAELLRTVDRVDLQVERTSREMSDFKSEMNKRWGELANKMGTLAEDLVAPSIPRVLRLVVGCPNGRIDAMAVRVRRRHQMDRGRTQEFDVVAVCGEYVLINGTKSSLHVEDADDFVQVLSEVRGFFPEHAERKIIGALASLYVDESVVRYAQRLGLLVLGMSEEMMDLLNEPGFQPRLF
ncbi:MAG: hypothetical protein U9Q78_01105, partial [Chloroflexota bacterium]|nr:hypothetical protein [Chloroflexota bacterium]